MYDESRSGNQQAGVGPAQHSTGNGSSLGAQASAWLDAQAIAPSQREGITRATTVTELPAELRCWGAKVLPAFCFTWRSAGGRVVPQIRPDTPLLGSNGKKIKYMFPKGSGAVVGIACGFDHLQNDSRVPVLLIEGTKQLLAAASVLPVDQPIAVPFGIAGCWGWCSEGKPCEDLNHMALEGREVLVGFDADFTTSFDVYQAAKRLKDYLIGEFLVKSVRFLQIPGGEKDGFDDLLSRVAPDRRLPVLRKLITDAIELPARGPRKPAKGGSEFFDENGNLRAQTLWQFLDQEHHLALAGDNSIAVYNKGVYWNGKSKQFTKLVGETLGDYFKLEHMRNVEEYGIAQMKVAGRVIPFKQPQPWLNFRNGILDLNTGRLMPHTHQFLTLVQWPFDWDELAMCSRFDQWLEEQLPGQGEVLLDSCSQMLDQTRQPTRMVFLWGPSRSGKSTMLRILRALAGGSLCSSVSLHKLSDRNSGAGRFAPARLFGKVLNTFADLSSDDLQDLSIFKSLTGEDTIDAEYKGKDGFDLENMAMLAFSANAVPSVSEGSQAYFARSAVFHFSISFLGAEDPSIEEQMMTELPGIMRRLVHALIARRKRNLQFLSCNASTMAAFARHSDRVQLFLHQATRPGDRSLHCILRSDLYQRFKEWAEEEQGGKGRILGKQKFNDRVRNAGVTEFKPASGSWTWNLLPTDPETAEADPENAEQQAPKPPTTAHQPAGQPIPTADPLPYGGFEPETAVVTAAHQNPVTASTFADPAPPTRQSRQNAPIPPPIEHTSEFVLANAEYVDSAETADRLQTVTQRIEQVLAEHRLDPSHPQARNIATAALVGTASKQQVTLALEQLRLEDRNDFQENLF